MRLGQSALDSQVGKLELGKLEFRRWSLDDGVGTMELGR